MIGTGGGSAVVNDDGGLGVRDLVGVGGREEDAGIVADAGYMVLDISEARFEEAPYDEGITDAEAGATGSGGAGEPRLRRGIEGILDGVPSVEFDAADEDPGLRKAERTEESTSCLGTCIECPRKENGFDILASGDKAVDASLGRSSSSKNLKSRPYS